MIDIETLVFDTVYNQTIQQYPSANITAGYDEQEASSLTVIIRETNNQPYRNSATDDCSENHTRLTYEIEVVSDKENTGRSECREVLDFVDTVMQSMKFRRIHKNRPINIDRTRWRQYARYEVICDKGTQVTRIVDGQTVTDTVYHMYRR